MRKQFAEKLMTYDNVVVLTADLGYGVWDDRVINVGAAEQLMLGAGVGLALEGNIAVVYSITPFLLWRPYEWIRNYLNNEKIPVKMVGSGRGNDYEHDGFTHYAGDDVNMAFPNIVKFWPKSIEEMLNNVEEMMTNGKPCYLNLRRFI